MTDMLMRPAPSAVQQYDPLRSVSLPRVAAVVRVFCGSIAAGFASIPVGRPSDSCIWNTARFKAALIPTGTHLEAPVDLQANTHICGRASRVTERLFIRYIGPTPHQRLCSSSADLRIVGAAEDCGRWSARRTDVGKSTTGPSFGRLSLDQRPSTLGCSQIPVYNENRTRTHSISALWWYSDDSAGAVIISHGESISHIRL
ncbi:hypothetical protein K466DRAFT_132527 [Polyporus arcularius HHB13444]|uniref:Uncharacterized protein n=1 Tax=Polyporus arcularius HHB13444 TaxID=1314778 RepID=A0A5C3PLV2_9APHY|nr:hypothetical protein K466DRAFT_132527 [Polyporus arcularius HHB13444]